MGLARWRLGLGLHAGVMAACSMLCELPAHLLVPSGSSAAARRYQDLAAKDKQRYASAMADYKAGGG